MAEEYVIRTPEDIARLRARLREPEPFLKSAGVLLKRESDRAFSEQRLGEYEWPARYPSQGEPFVNFAAVLEAANRGQEPESPRFYSRRPALRGTGELQKSVGFAVAGNEVEVGSSLAHAGLHQHGGETSFPVTDGARTLLRNWAFRVSTAGSLGLSGEAFSALANQAETRKKARRKALKMQPRVRKVFLLSYLHNWKQNVIKRPFIGVTELAGKRLSEAAEHFLARGA